MQATTEHTELDAWSTARRVRCAALLVIIPAVCFTLSFTLVPECRTNRFENYIKLALSIKASPLFLPFVAFAVFAALAALFRPGYARREAWVHLGIAAGLVVSLQFTLHIGICLLYRNICRSLPLALMLTIAGYTVSLLLLLLLKMVAQRLWHWIRACRRPQSLGLLAIWGAVMGVLALIAFHKVREVACGFGGVSIMLALLFTCIFGAPICFLIFLQLARHIILPAVKTRRFSDTLGIPEVFCLAAYLGIWRLVVWRTAEAYAALPASCSGCFVVTAAARGHAAVVGSSWRSMNGQPSVSNAQLRTFKCFEIAIATLAPGLHGRFRRVYNRLGPRVAARVSTPCRADVAYLLLKPLEYTAAVLLFAAGLHGGRRPPAALTTAPPPVGDANA